MTHDSYSALQWGVLASTLLYPDISGEFELGGAPLELDTKVHPKIRNHGEGPYGLLLQY